MILEIGLTHYLLVSAAVFCLGILGMVVNFKNVICSLLSLELMLLSANINLVAFSRYNDDITGQIFSIFIIAVAAAEAAIGLAILLIYYRKHKSITLDTINRLKG